VVAVLLVVVGSVAVARFLMIGIRMPENMLSGI
jgi:hypothetical protein